MELPKVYEHDKYEQEIYSLWEKNGLFMPKIPAQGRNDRSTEPYTIIMPPPNANADLHIGHAMYVIEDILIRFERMRGKSALYLPGADHAGFETQVVFEKHLDKEGKSRFDLERKDFYDAVFEFVQKNKSTMENQLRRLGMSADWTREKFTLDPDIVETVQETFLKLYKDDLVYRGERVVNFCTKHGTSFSDLEVQDKEQDTFLWHVTYPLEDNSGEIIVATTRPETMFGDVAVAVNPTDKRYKKFIGKTLILPITSRKIPVVADPAVDKKFGTGAVKVTPAHDPLDFEIGVRHNLPRVQVIGFNGRMTDAAGEFRGLKVKEAREKIVEKLKEIGVLREVKPHKNVVGTCYKCGSVLEPLILPQWFVKIAPLAKPAIEAVKKGKITIIPKRYEKVFFHWMENIRDWNISRQIWWGIPIPAWYCENNHIVILSEAKDLKDSSPVAQNDRLCPECSLPLKQDPDTFDTWFSSGQWPYATLGYPNSDDYKHFYPTDVMATAADILFFWVARMIMLGIYRTGKIPFHTVYLHGLVRDKEGQKISKSKGNVINPIEMIDKYGSDALRMSMISGPSAGTDLSMSEEKIRGYRNFANKVWNAARYVLLFDGKVQTKINDDDKEFLTKLAEVTEKVTKNLEKLRINEAAGEIYQFFWHYYADAYIEKTKNRREEAQETLVKGLIIQLKLLHPFLPFLSEKLWQEMKQNGYLKGEEPFLISSRWATKKSI